jgi:hypothetical protein
LEGKRERRRGEREREKGSLKVIRKTMGMSKIELFLGREEGKG